VGIEREGTVVKAAQVQWMLWPHAQLANLVRILASDWTQGSSPNAVDTTFVLAAI
jgi:hypothetical protein